MSPPVDLTLFALLVNRPDDEIDLAEAALLIAAAERPDLDVERYLGTLDRLGRVARLRRGEDRLPDGGVSRVLRFLYEELGYKGNASQYHDPRNSFLDEVIDRRTGIPITLAIVLVEVGRRAGIELAGVSFPGHFLVRAPGTHGPTWIDPFVGRVLGRTNLRELYKRATGKDEDPESRLLEPCTKRAILARLLGNLRGLYASQSDPARLRGVLERLVLVGPTKEIQADLVRLGGARPFRGGSSAEN